MIIKSKRYDNSGDSFGEVVNSSIDNAAMGFILKLASEGLYSDIKGSIVRELVSNCVDAHKEIGQDRPVLITFGHKNGIDYISFRDFGTGMSPDFIRNVYSSWYSSTKRESNDYIGAFGIGSKSPLAYADSYTVKTIYEGRQYEYVMYKTDEMPKMELISEDETEEHSGTDIIIDLESSYDFTLFAQSCIKHLPYFENIHYVIDIPQGRTVSGELVRHVETLNSIRILEGNSFKIAYSELPNTKINQVPHICLGRVMYPINLRDFSGDFIISKKGQKIADVKNNYNWDYISWLKNWPIGIKLEIGSVQVTPSRENIVLDTETKELVKNKLIAAITEIVHKTYKVQDSSLSDYLLGTGYTTRKDYEERSKVVLGGKVELEVPYRVPILYKKVLPKTYNSPKLSSLVDSVYYFKNGKAFTKYKSNTDINYIVDNEKAAIIIVKNFIGLDKNKVEYIRQKYNAVFVRLSSIKQIINENHVYIRDYLTKNGTSKSIAQGTDRLRIREGRISMRVRWAKVLLSLARTYLMSREHTYLYENIKIDEQSRLEILNREALSRKEKRLAEQERLASMDFNIYVYPKAMKVKKFVKERSADLQLTRLDYNSTRIVIHEGNAPIKSLLKDVYARTYKVFYGFVGEEEHLKMLNNLLIGQNEYLIVKVPKKYIKIIQSMDNFIPHSDFFNVKYNNKLLINITTSVWLQNRTNIKSFINAKESWTALDSNIEAAINIIEKFLEEVRPRVEKGQHLELFVDLVENKQFFNPAIMSLYKYIVSRTGENSMVNLIDEPDATSKSTIQYLKVIRFFPNKIHTGKKSSLELQEAPKQLTIFDNGN